MNFLRSTLHVTLMLAFAMSSVLVRGQNASADSARPGTTAKRSCCHDVCPCAGKARTPAAPMPAAPTSEARTNVDPSPSIPVEPRLVVRRDAMSDALPSKAFQRAREASRQTALPLHVQVCVFLI